MVKYMLELEEKEKLGRKFRILNYYTQTTQKFNYLNETVSMTKSTWRTL